MFAPSLISLRRISVACVAMLCMITAVSSANAQSYPIPYTIGSSNTASADPPVVVPNTTPCVVNLFTNFEFDNFNNMPYTYSPGCPGPWSKVVLVGNYYITPGVQFDRTSQIFLNGVDLYFGTTPEPTSATENDPWHFENDVTDYSSLFATSQSGYASLGNLVNSTYTGIIYGTVDVYFYPAAQQNPAPVTADVVYALPSGGGATIVNNGSPSFSTTLTLPTNMKNMYVDVVSQSQNEEEQWFYCLPNDIASEFDDCGNTNFRETDISIDGVLAGAAPVSSWIYTGGLDPYFWFPIPGNQTLNLKAYRVDLSPFAGTLSDGNPHTITVGVFNAFEYFTETASLLVYEDHGSARTGGRVTRNTLSLPNPNVVENISTDPSGDVFGTVVTTSRRNYTISGTVYTSKGVVTNSVNGNLNFANGTYLYASGDGNVYTQNVGSTYTAEQFSQNGFLTAVKSWSFPLNLQLTDTYDPNTAILAQVANVDQTFDQTTGSEGGIFGRIYEQVDYNNVQSADTLIVNYNTGTLSNQDQSSSQVYFQAVPGYCYYQTLQAANNALTGFSGIPGCEDNPDAGSSDHRKGVASREAKPLYALHLHGPVARKAESAR